MTADLDAGSWRAQFAGRLDDGAAVHVGPGRRWSGVELCARAGGAIMWLESIGVDQGAAVPALLTAGPAALALTVAGALWDRPVAPLGPRLAPTEVAHCVRGLQAGVIVTEPAHLELARAVADRTGARVELLPGTFAAVARDFASTVDDDNVVAYLHTSGTTGLPKAVPIREHRLARRVALNAAGLQLDGRSVYTTAAGYHHIAGLGMILVVLASGGSVAPLPTFSIDAWRELANVGPTHGLLVPTQIDMLLEAGALELPTLEVLQYGASPIHPDTLRAALAAVPRARFVQIYGQTEGSPIAILDHEDHLDALAGEPALLASNGRAVPGLELEIVAIDGSSGANGVGEVRARAEHLFVAGPDGWLATGDLGRLDDRGFLYLVGRCGDGIIRGGENVFPLEVERALEAHPGVGEAAVVGVPDRRLGQRVAAFVVIAPGGSAPSDADLVTWCRERLAHFKVPERWTRVGALPRNAAGKLVRRRLEPGSEPPTATETR